ncbi:uncharacterized protein EURHEDRAFT_295967 [Aspergillus ruber CBS 135680]|uniref:F-box domain-containing protein n=1 Tax=Aspergillus ruber (strain CBS 135680) TaxID=1388766 RepID=A0A017SL50_ASPRC|nr:uncharacterized protein EURHEDRAFT_295967 [Aspergillus ruber CBS 135680]EYE97496.1 hypothetical protein EURHEDRAFT_295967 [Aspergillus ruber CBS 135680]
MPLQTLPVETIYEILRLVGIYELRRQKKVCKWWYTLADPILLETVILTATRLTPMTEQRHAKLKVWLKSLIVDMCCFEHWPGEKSNGALGDILTLQYCRLSSFSFRAHSEHVGVPLAPRTNYTSKWTPARFLDAPWLSKLSELGIDTCGSGYKNGIHVCPRLALKIPHLRYVQLRTLRICPEIFDLQYQDGARSSKIRGIVIKVSFKEMDRFTAGFSTHCTESKGGRPLYNDMVRTATEMAKQTQSLKVLIILIHNFPKEMVVKNCIAGTKMLISDERDWDWSDKGHTSQTLRP